jgi:hypothetical protein
MAWKDLSTVCGSYAKHEELMSNAELATKGLITRFDRDAGRRKRVKVMWFAENWAFSGRWFLTLSSSKNR